MVCLTDMDRACLPDVDEALNIGYAFHVADDTSLPADNLTRQNARKVAEHFLSLKPEPNTPASGYLACLRGIVTSHSRGITRRKQVWLDALSETTRFRNDAYERIRESRKGSDLFAIVMKFLPPIALWLVGFMVAKLLSDFVPEEVSQQTGTKVPSVIVGIIFVLMGRAVSFWWSDLFRSQVEYEYQVRRELASKMYELGKLEEYHTYREHLVQAWKEYTGEEYPTKGAYQMVMEADMAAKENLAKTLESIDRTTFALFRRFWSSLRRRKTVTEPVSG